MAALVIALQEDASWRWRRVGRLLWTVGCASALAHIAAAMVLVHHGSHAHAAAETSRRTAELIGWSWGGEIYFNYAFAAVWAGDVAWQWLAPHAYQRRSWKVSAAIHAFLFFMAFNATVIFETGAVRLGGLVALCLLGAMWVVRRRRQRLGRPPRNSPA